MTTEVGIVGHEPSPVIGNGNAEVLKYGRLWEMPDYRLVAPGEQLAPLFVKIANPKPGQTVIDFGCGTGRGALALKRSADLKVIMVDFVRNCLDDTVHKELNSDLQFHKLDLQQPLPFIARYGYCTDVMEHIPPDKVDVTLDHVLKAAQNVFFSIATDKDVCGKLIDEELHLTVQPYQWWLKKFVEREAVILWSRRLEKSSLFYVSAWVEGRDITASGMLNIEVAEIRANVAHNIKQGWQQATAHDCNDIECMIVGGGPSLNEFADEIKERRAAGVKLITLNGAYNWCVERGITPSAQIVVDARQFNKRFVKPVVEGCKYLLASQCHPSVFEDLPKESTYLWHASPKDIEDLLQQQYGEQWFSVPGGSSVLLRAIPLMRTLGYRMFHLYGCDSCIGSFGHHAYAQPENDPGVALPVTLSDGKIFYAHPWMISQAHEFMELIKRMGDLFDIEIHGDGLLKHILDVGASINKEDIYGSAGMENLS